MGAEGKGKRAMGRTRMHLEEKLGRETTMMIWSKWTEAASELVRKRAYQSTQAWGLVPV